MTTRCMAGIFDHAVLDDWPTYARQSGQRVPGASMLPSGVDRHFLMQAV